MNEKEYKELIEELYKRIEDIDSKLFELLNIERKNTFRLKDIRRKIMKKGGQYGNKRVFG